MRLGPSLAPIDHVRTSEQTAMVHRVEYKNFPAKSQVRITYYDGEENVGEFPGGKKHRLKNLTKSTKAIKAIASDDYGNIAETTFIIDQNIPAISYEEVSRTATSVIIKGVHLKNFPNDEDVIIVYSCDNQIYKTTSFGYEHELAGLDQDWQGGIITAKASDVNSEVTAECQIHIEKPGKKQIIVVHKEKQTQNGTKVRTIFI